jgi:tetratricopeptide (TPR) repeat protein
MEIALADANSARACERYDRAKVTVFICAALALIVWIAFGGALDHQFLDYDDNTYVYQNPWITQGLSLSAIAWAFTHVHANNWHPLTTISHMTDCQLFGLQAWGHHLTNIVLHALATIFLFFALRELSGATKRATIWPSAFVAALFAVHPLRVESVAWVSERKDVLSGVFLMLTLWAYARYARSAGPTGGKYAAVVIWFTLGLLSKPTLVTLPAVLLLLDYWPLGRLQTQWRSLRGLVAEKIPLFVLSAGSCVATILAQQRALTDVRELPLLDRVGNALLAYSAYLGQLFYPAHLAVFYSFRRADLTPLNLVLSGALILGISIVCFAARRRYPFLLVGWLWFLGMLVPMIGLVQVGQQARADRYTYLPMIGLYILLAWSGIALIDKWRRGRMTGALAAIAIVVALVAQSYAQTEYWRDTQTIWEHAANTTRDNYIAHYTLGNVLAQKRQTDQAIEHYKKSLQIDPNYAQTHNNLGIAYAELGRFDEAIAEYQTALRLRPNFAETYNNLGIVLATVGRPEEAMERFEQALQVRPNYPEVHLNLARLLAQRGRRDEADIHLAEAKRLQAAQSESKPQPPR